VRWVYQSFVAGGLPEGEIAKRLNERGICTDYNRAWTRGTVHQLLTNEKYIGNNVYYRTSFKLKKEHVKNPSEQWVRAENVFEPLITAGQFWEAQAIIEARCRHFTDEEMLEKLKSVFQMHGKISGLIIDEHEDMPSSSSYRTRFGSLVRAYQLIGYTPEIDYAYIEINRLLRKQHPDLVTQVISGLNNLGATVESENATDVLLINHEYRASVALSRCLKTEAGASRWCIRLEHGNQADITIAARMTESNSSIKDFYLLPRIDVLPLRHLRLTEDNGTMFDGYRFDDLSYFFALAERVRVEDAA